MDSNGYNPTLFPEFSERAGFTARHEIFGGPNRQQSKKWGCWIALRPEEHERMHKDAAAAMELKRECQKRFEEKHDRETFVRIFGKNYMED